MGTPLASRDAQADEVVTRLYDRYPEPEISLDFSNRLELLVAVVLSAQCTDERVNERTPDLFEKYPTAADYAAADEEELAEDIYGITFHNSKASYLKGIGEQLVEAHDGEVPDTMDALTDLPGVGRKTANVVLQHGHDVVEGVVVDTHVQRLSRSVRAAGRCAGRACPRRSPRRPRGRAGGRRSRSSDRRPGGRSAPTSCREPRRRAPRGVSR